ncbi:unnamed protein product [Ceutorhynchus assimilis]|uniref:Uncharacterized protein n=1 Tax=Ceutorhynchus assimilis TaxID=467358 RepID=A0A9N9QK62_9CUCU|nr:unnamed protein product [Ceutorhynchus assimilis]
MHFWINKGNQQGHYWPRACRLVRPPPEAVANYLARHQIIRPRGLHPKPMVTPVRRFQSLESVSNNGLRHHGRTSPGQRPNNNTRPTIHNNILYYNNVTSSRPSRLERERSLDNVEQTSPQTLDNNELESYIRKFKFALLAFALFSICVMFGANYLSSGQLWRLGVETLVIISVALVVLLLGGIIILYLDERQNSATTSQQTLETTSPNQLNNDLQERPSVDYQRPTRLSIADVQEMSPPPYHIAIRLANQNDLEEIRIYDDQSPPPPYEKAIT